MRDGEYIRVWAHEVDAHEAAGWTVVSMAGRTGMMLHGAGYAEALMYRPAVSHDVAARGQCGPECHSSADRPEPAPLAACVPFRLPPGT